MNKNIKKTVYKILERDINARCDDNYLILRAIQELDPKFQGTDECQYAEDPIKEIKQILGIQEEIKIEQNRDTI